VAALELEFSEPAVCELSEVTFRVEQVLGRPLASVAGPSFRVGVEHTSGGLTGRIDIAASNAGASGLRRITASTCDELIDTLALTVVLAIGRSRVPEAAALESTGASEAAPESADSPAPADAAAAPVLPAKATRPDWAIFGSLLGDTGSLPGSGLGVGFGAGIAWTAIELRAVGTWLPRRQGWIDASDPASPGAEMELFAAGVLGCLPFATRTPVLIAACAGAEAGKLSARGARVDVARSRVTTWLAPRVDLGARWALWERSLGLELMLTAAAPLTRDEFVLRGIGSVYQPASVVGRASLGLRWDFGSASAWTGAGQ
jgi:hypothetical protein